MEIKVGIHMVEVKTRANPLARGVRMSINRGILIITSRRKLSDDHAHRIVLRNSDWVMGQIDKLTTSGLEDGRIINVLGEEFAIEFKDTEKEISEHDGKFIVSKKFTRESQARKSLSNYLKTKYGKLVKLRAEELGVEHGFEFGNVSIRDQSSRWGSCSRNKNLNFNWRLIFAPVEVMDYVIIHEFCHTVFFDHSSNFWQLVKKHMPDYENQKLWLKRHGDELLEF